MLSPTSMGDSLTFNEYVDLRRCSFIFIRIGVVLITVITYYIISLPIFGPILGTAWWTPTVMSTFPQSLSLRARFTNVGSIGRRDPAGQSCRIDWEYQSKGSVLSVRRLVGACSVGPLIGCD